MSICVCRTARALLACALVTVTLAAASAGSPGKAHASLREFYPTGEFDYEIDGVKADARILFSRRAAAYLVMPVGQKRMYLLQQRQRSVCEVPFEFIERENGDVDLPESAAPQVVGSFEREGGSVTIKAPSFRARLTPRPSLLGSRTGSEVLAHSPQYGLTMRAYRTNEQALKSLGHAAGVRVDVLFGSWCPLCQQSLGYALRVDRALPGEGIQFSYYGLPAPPAAWKDARFLQSKAKALPVALVYVGDKFVGRVAAADWKKFDVALVKIVKPQ